MPNSASPTQIQTRRSGRIAGLKEEGNVGIKRPADVIAATGRARLKVDDEDEWKDITRFQIPIPKSEYAREDDTNLQVVISAVENLEDDKETIGCATELETPGTTSPRARGVKPTGRLSWADFVKLPCQSSEVYVDRNQSSCAVPAPKPRRVIDEMVQPPGPKWKSSYPKSTPKPNQQTKAFDLTGPTAFGEPPPKRLKTTDSDLGFPHRRRTSQDSDVRGYEKYNTGAVRNGSRSAASSTQPEHRPHNALNDFRSVNEFSNLQDMLHPSGNGSGKRQKNQDQSRDSLRHHTQEISDDDDPIEDEDPAVLKLQQKPQSTGYAGTAGLKPPRTKEQRAAANKSKKRPVISNVSQYFLEPEGVSHNGSQRPMVGGGNVPSTDRMHHGAGSKRANTAVEAISDDEAPPKIRRKGSQAGQAKSASLSQTGDIAPSFPSKKGNMFTLASDVALERAQGIFSVNLVKGDQDCFMATKEDGPACFIWRQDKSALHLSREGHGELHPTLAIGMNKIYKITCSNSPQSDGLFLIRQLEPYPKLMVVQLSAPQDAEKFLTYLRKITSGFKNPLRYDSVAMERVFKRAGDELDVHHYQRNQDLRSLHEIPEDIRLLESRKSARSDGRHHLSQSTDTPRPRRTLANSMNTEERPSRGRITGDPERPRIDPHTEMDRPATRSTRSQRIELLRSESPRPELWTDANRGWKDKWWKGDEPLIYPENGDKRATVDRQDIVRLNEGEFLNDNLLQFYLRYLEEKIKTENPAVAKRVLFMNPFFYQRLTTGKGRSYIDYDGVKRWTSKFDIFNFDYVIVPVNEHAHWYLAIICNTPAFLKPPQEEEPKAEDNDTSEADTSLLEVEADSAPAEKKAEVDSTTDVEEKVGSMTIDESDTIRVAEDETATKGPDIAPKQKKKKRKSLLRPRRYKTNEPRIITMDSLGYPHSPTCSHLRDFLIAEAKARHGIDVVLREKSVGMTAKNIPEQNNHCDCGLFLLGYVEYFLENPDGMMHDLMQQKPEVMERFAKLDAHKMRNDIRQLLFNLKKTQTERQQAEKNAKIEKRRAKEASEASGSLPPTAEPTPAVSPERSGTTSSDDKGGVALSVSQRNSVEPAEEESIIEVEKPATLAATNTEKRSSPVDSGFDQVMDDLAGYDTQKQEVHRQHPPNSQSVEYIAAQPREEPLHAPPMKQKHNLQTSRSVEYISETRSSPAGSGSEFTARKAIECANRQRHPESLPLSSDEENEPEVTMETSVRKKTPSKRDTAMSPVPAPSAFKGTGQKVGKTGPPRAARGPSSDLDAPRKHSVVDLEEESDDLPSQPISRELRTRQKESLPPKQQHTNSNKSTTPAQKQPTKANEGEEGTPIPVKIFTPLKQKLSERVTVKRSQSQTQTKNERGGTHIKFGDEEMLLNGDDEDKDSSQDSLKCGMSPTALGSAAKKIPSVEITPGRKSQITFNEDSPSLLKSLLDLPGLPMRNATTPPKQTSTRSSPSQAVRSSPRNAVKHSTMGNDSVRRAYQPIRPPNKNSVAASSPSQGRRLPPTNKHYKPSGSSGENSKAVEDGKGRAEEPIELD